MLVDPDAGPVQMGGGGRTPKLEAQVRKVLELPGDTRVGISDDFGRNQSWNGRNPPKRSKENRYIMVCAHSMCTWLVSTIARNVEPPEAARLAENLGDSGDSPAAVAQPSKSSMNLDGNSAKSTRMLCSAFTA